MELSNIQDVRLQEGGGVTFKYLALTLELQGEKKCILRALNYTPYREGMEEEIIAWTKEELDELGFFRAGGDFVVLGGGTLTVNPYDETICLYGSNKPYGPERDRQAVALTVQSAFPNHKVSWFSAASAAPKKAVKQAPSIV